MIVIVDTNIIISAILNPSGKVGLNFIYPNEKIIFIAPEYLKKEIGKHRNRLIKIGGLTEEDFDVLKDIIFTKINFYAEEIFADFINHQTLSLMKNGDPKDIPFVAMALFFNVKVWTGDKKLKNHLLTMGLDICITTEDIHNPLL
jgi:predicted nucleic acid-binding protein